MFLFVRSFPLLFSIELLFDSISFFDNQISIIKGCTIITESSLFVKIIHFGIKNDIKKC